MGVNHGIFVGSVPESAVGGDVVGPNSSTNNGIAVFDGTTGKLLKDGGATIASLAPTANPSFTGDVDILNSATLFAQLSTDSSGNLNIALTEKAPGALTCALAGAGAGNVDNGVHRYKVTFVTAGGETEAGTASSTVTVVDKTANGKVALSAIPTGSSFVTSRKIYRTLAGGSTYKLLDTIADNTTTTYTDNTADSGLTTTAPTANTAIDNREIVRQGSVPYKSYLPLISQTGTSAPTAIVLENTLSGAVVWTRNDVGDYYGTLTGAFAVNKVGWPSGFLLGTKGNFYRTSRLDDNTIHLESIANNEDGTFSASDDLLNGTYVPIIVYP